MVMKMMTRKLFHLPQQYPRQCFFVFALCCMLLFVFVDCCYCILVFPDQPTRLRRSVRRLLRLKWQPPTLVTTQQRPDMSDCAQTWFKSDQKTTPTSDSVYLSEQPLHRIRVVKRHSCYTDNKLSLIFDPNKKRVICDWYIFATNPVNPGQSKSFSFGLLHSSPNLISS